MSTRPRALPAVGSALALPAIVHTPPSRVATGKVHQGTPQGFATAYSPTLAPRGSHHQWLSSAGKAQGWQRGFVAVGGAEWVCVWLPWGLFHPLGRRGPVRTAFRFNQGRSRVW